MQEAARVAQDAMREQLEEVERPDAGEHPPLEHVLPRPREHPHLAPVLVLEVARRLLARDRLGLVDGALAALDHRVGQAEVLAEAMRHVVRAPHGEDRAVAARDRAERATRSRAATARSASRSPSRFVPSARSRRELAADVRDVLVGEVADELAQRVRRPLRVRVGERDDVARALADGVVQRGELAAARERAAGGCAGRAPRTR